MSAREEREKGKILWMEDSRRENVLYIGITSLKPHPNSQSSSPLVENKGTYPNKKL